MISVCTATYNGSRFIEEQLSSILKQIDDNDEIIISDDGSTDDTIKKILSFNDDRIKILYNNGHCYTANFENALRHAKGDYIFLSDQDDIWHDNKVEKCVALLDRYDFVVSNARIIDSQNSVKEESRHRIVPVRRGFFNNLIKTYYLGCCMAFRRCILEVALPFPRNRELCFHDSWISMIAERYFKTFVCEDPLIDYRRHENNLSAGSVGINNSIVGMIRVRAYLLIEVTKRGKKVKQFKVR